HLCPYAPSSPLPTDTLSLHDALPIFPDQRGLLQPREGPTLRTRGTADDLLGRVGYDRAPRPKHALQPDDGPGDRLPSHAYEEWRSEEHTSELQSLRHLVCRLLLEKKK